MFQQEDNEKLEETVQFILKAGMEGCVYCNTLMTENTETTLIFSRKKVKKWRNFSEWIFGCCMVR